MITRSKKVNAVIPEVSLLQKKSKRSASNSTNSRSTKSKSRESSKFKEKSQVGFFF